MFERFTERARLVTVEALNEARDRNIGEIRRDHLLVGLTVVEGLAREVLAELGVTAEMVRERLDESSVRGDERVVGQVPFAVDAKKTLELALREALSMGHNYVGTEHILLAVTRGTDSASVAGQVLHPQRVRDAVIQKLSGRPRVPPREDRPILQPSVRMPVELPPLHRGEVPEADKLLEWTLADWQGLLEELHYAADDRQEPLFTAAHDALWWLLIFYLSRRMNP
jgi:ATP-dependent Clp protease ATP-binding subunit ClpA